MDVPKEQEEIIMACIIEISFAQSSEFSSPHRYHPQMSDEESFKQWEPEEMLFVNIALVFLIDKQSFALSWLY